MRYMTSTKTFFLGLGAWAMCGVCSYFDGVPNGFHGFLEWSAWAFFGGFIILGIVSIFLFANDA